MKITVSLGNNGGRWADYFHDNDLLKDGMSLDDCYEIAMRWDLTGKQHKWLSVDDFWGDFAYRAEELNYKLHY